MRKWLSIFLYLFPWIVFASDQENRRLFFYNLSNLEFEKAEQYVQLETDAALRVEMQQLTNLLYYEGQKENEYSSIINTSSGDNKLLSSLRALNSGYVSLFYDKVKGNAFKNFYKAYQLAKESNTAPLIKASLLALLKYYNLEIAQNSDAYMPYLNHFEQMQTDSSDRIWSTLYRMIFYTKSLGELNDYYFKLAKMLDQYEKALTPTSPLLAHIYYEKALKFEIGKDPEHAKIFYRKTLDQAGSYPFLKYHRFFACLKLMVLETHERNFPLAQRYFNRAKTESNLSDTLRSNYHLNFYGAVFLHAQDKNDSAFVLLNKAYVEDFRLDFRRNTLEINRLNVELETQEKENANLRLRASRAWLTVALTGVALLFILSYFAYKNQLSKTMMHASEKKVQEMKVEKLLKEHELFGINSMIEGQEKERQRIANDLHDNLGSLLATLKLHFQTLNTKRDKLGSDQELLFEKTDGLIEEAYQKVRSMAHAKNAGVNAQEGLLPAVKNFASKVSIINKLVIDVEDHGMDERLENILELAIFRIIQELITNVIKHANATEVTIHLTQYEDKINLMVEDNGVGFDPSQIRGEGTMGLYSIQKRIENLGGTVTIDSILQSGTTVILDIPL